MLMRRYQYGCCETSNSTVPPNGHVIRPEVEDNFSYDKGGGGGGGGGVATTTTTALWNFSEAQNAVFLAAKIEPSAAAMDLARTLAAEAWSSSDNINNNVDDVKAAKAVEPGESFGEEVVACQRRLSDGGGGGDGGGDGTSTASSSQGRVATWNLAGLVGQFQSPPAPADYAAGSSGTSLPHHYSSPTPHYHGHHVHANPHHYHPASAAAAAAAPEAAVWGNAALPSSSSLLHVHHHHPSLATLTTSTAAPYKIDPEPMPLSSVYYPQPSSSSPATTSNVATEETLAATSSASSLTATSAAVASATAIASSDPLPTFAPSAPVMAAAAAAPTGDSPDVLANTLSQYLTPPEMHHSLAEDGPSWMADPSASLAMQLSSSTNHHNPLLATDTYPPDYAIGSKGYTDRKKKIIKEWNSRSNGPSSSSPSSSSISELLGRSSSSSHSYSSAAAAAAAAANDYYYNRDESGVNLRDYYQGNHHHHHHHAAAAAVAVHHYYQQQQEPFYSYAALHHASANQFHHGHQLAGGGGHNQHHHNFIDPVSQVAGGGGVTSGISTGGGGSTRAGGKRKRRAGCLEQQLLNPHHHHHNNLANMSRDERKANILNLPMGVRDIINLPMDEFNDLLSKHELTEDQLSLCRDIRRRGKNKVAARNCRKRKIEQIKQLEEDVTRIRSQKTDLVGEHDQLVAQRNRWTEMVRGLHDHVLTELGHDPIHWQLQMDHNRQVHILPRSRANEADPHRVPRPYHYAPALGPPMMEGGGGSSQR